MLLRNFLHPLEVQCGLRNDLLIGPIENQKTSLYSVEKPTKGREGKGLRIIAYFGLGTSECSDYSSSRAENYSCNLLNEYMG
ncbi:MAG TPA: hypothetical protein VH796_16385 [Nitrososphaeraceae archaeon]